MSRKLLFWVVCFLIVGLIFLSGCTQNIQKENNTSSEKTSNGIETPPTPENFPQEQNPETAPPTPP